MVNFVQNIIKTTFVKLFINIAKDFEAEVSEIQLKIHYVEGVMGLQLFKNNKFIKEINFDDYIDTMILLTGGGELIKATIMQSGVIFSHELSTVSNCEVCDKKGELECPCTDLAACQTCNGEGKQKCRSCEKVSIDDIKIVLAANGEDFPKAVLMKNDEKIRAINLKDELIAN